MIIKESIVGEIKSKLWLVESKEWVSEFFISQNGQYFIFDDDGNFLPSPFKEEIKIVQYTGLKDKNDKEIYEGDIIKLYNYSVGFKCPECGFKKIKDLIGEIVWINLIVGDEYNRPTAEFKIRHGFKYTSLEWIDDIEIIGNIYENPELLEVK